MSSARNQAYQIANIYGERSVKNFCVASIAIPGRRVSLVVIVVLGSNMFVERFMTWSVQSGADQRAKAISRLAAKLFNGSIPEIDRSDVEQALTLYLEDPSAKVRQALARVVARYDNAPRHLVWALARDITEVSEKIYARSTILRSRDLIDAICRGDDIIQCAIANREDLDGDTIRRLVKHAGADAICQLIQNRLVVLGPGLKHDIADRLGDNAQVRTMLLGDDCIDAATRQLLADRLSNCLLNLVDTKGWGDPNRLQKTANDARNKVTVEIAMQTPPEHMVEYVEHLQTSGQLSAALLIRACCTGHAALFENALSLLSGVSLKRVQSIVDDGRVAAFKSLYGRTGLPSSAYPVFVAAIEAWRVPQEMPQLIGQIIARAEVDHQVDGALLAMLSQMACEANREAAQDYSRQLMLAAA